MELAETTDDVERIYGSGAAGSMQRADEFAVNPTQKRAPGAEVAFPLEKWEYPIGWTREYFLKSTARRHGDLAERRDHGAPEAGHLRDHRAIYGSANVSFVDKLGRVQKTLTVKPVPQRRRRPDPGRPQRRGVRRLDGDALHGDERAHRRRAHRRHRQRRLKVHGRVDDQGRHQQGERSRRPRPHRVRGVRRLPPPTLVRQQRPEHAAQRLVPAEPPHRALRGRRGVGEAVGRRRLRLRLRRGRADKPLVMRGVDPSPALPARQSRRARPTTRSTRR